MNHRLAVAAGLVATWCLIVMAMGVQNAHTVWEPRTGDLRALARRARA
jgi:hypothetical protein